MPPEFAGHGSRTGAGQSYRDSPRGRVWAIVSNEGATFSGLYLRSTPVELNEQLKFFVEDNPLDAELTMGS
jgi:hypothetical protein